MLGAGWAWVGQVPERNLSPEGPVTQWSRDIYNVTGFSYLPVLGLLLGLPCQQQT